MRTQELDLIARLEAERLVAEHGSPLYIYSRAYLRRRAGELLALCQSHDVRLRYAVKANPHPGIIGLFDGLGLHFDASSAFEAEHLIHNGVNPQNISLSSQQPPTNLKQLLDKGVKFVATSLHQLELIQQTGFKGELAVRLNPGVGAGHNNRTTTAGAAAGFGIWHEYLPKVLQWQAASGCVISRLHVHIGSGGDSQVWRPMINDALKLVEQLPSVNSLDMGGGYKVARMPGEPEADMAEILEIFSQELSKFQAQTGRAVKLEIEPGSWLVANAGVLVSKIVDITETGKDGYNFIKLDTGMNDFLRTSLYGAQHPIEILNDETASRDYVVIGHNCESGDILTTVPGDPERIQPRRLNQAKIGDLVAIDGVGAYGASMRAVGYNSYPPAVEILVDD